MKVIAKKSFVGLVSMSVGETRDIQTKEVLDDLLRAGFVEAVEEKPKAKPKTKTEEKPEAKTPAKKTTTAKKTTKKKK